LQKGRGECTCLSRLLERPLAEGAWIYGHTFLPSKFSYWRDHLQKGRVVVEMYGVERQTKPPKQKQKQTQKENSHKTTDNKTNLAFCCVWLCLVALWKRVFFARYTAPFEVLYWKRPLAEGMVMCVSVYAWKKTSFPQQNRAKQTTNWDDKAILTEDLQIWDLAPFSVGPLGKKFISSTVRKKRVAFTCKATLTPTKTEKGRKT
jgi:hypothetical protein